uniref:Uncharacterized protein n=1 Tax=Arundo donax TaxID=35708 RepID=A0A0A8ZMZ1_ARUDO
MLLLPSIAMILPRK